MRLALPNYPEPTSYFLTQSYYQNAKNIVSNVANALGVRVEIDEDFQTSQHHDIPGAWFKGPFLNAVF